MSPDTSLSKKTLDSGRNDPIVDILRVETMGPSQFPFLDIVCEQMPVLHDMRRLAIFLHEGDIRKLPDVDGNPRPYDRHVQRVAEHCARLPDINSSDRFDMLTAALLHDIVEVSYDKPKGKVTLHDLGEMLELVFKANNRPFVDSRVKRIKSLVRGLTPPLREELEISAAEKRRFKLTTDLTIWEQEEHSNPTNRILKNIKAADILANLGETYEDVLNGIDSWDKKNSVFATSLKERMRVFYLRIKQLNEKDPTNPFLSDLKNIWHLLHTHLYNQVSQKFKEYIFTQDAVA